MEKFITYILIPIVSLAIVVLTIVFATEFHDKYFNKEQKRRHEVLPGISGWAQVNGRNDVTIQDKIKNVKKIYTGCKVI